MGRSCFVCGAKYPLKTLNTSTLSNRFALHSFPQHAETCAAWKTFCDLPSDYPISGLKNHRICSSHFSAFDYIDIAAKDVGGTRLTLKSGAIPSILSYSTDKTVDIVASAENPHNWRNTFTPDRPSKAWSCQSESPEVFHQALDIATSTENLHNLQNTCTSNNQLSCEVFLWPLESPELLTVEIVSVPIDDIEDCIESFNKFEEHNYALPFFKEPCSAESNENTSVTPKKRKFANPRFISEVETPDLATPVKARRTLTFIKSEDKRKTEKVKTLQQKNYYLQKRVRILEDLVKSLKKKRTS